MGNGMMLLKLDLEKAYNRLYWDFILDTLRELGLPDWLVNLNMKCITGSSMRVLSNGEVIKEFTSSRGICQGALSPYIFILCMERLAHRINLAVNKGEWKLIKIGRKCLELSHVFFANDFFC